MWNNYPGQGAPQQGGWGAPPPQGQPGGYAPPPGGPWGAPPPMPGGGYFSPPPGAPPPGGYNQGQPGYPGPPGPPGGNQGSLDQFSWNPRMGPPPNVHGQGGHGGGHGGYGGYSAPPGGPQQGYAPGGNWVPDHQGGQFYSAPMGTPHMPPSTPQYGGPPQAEQQYQYSQCTGRKKALCIGINYPGTDGELRGCINDALNMKNFLMQRFGFKENDIVMLLDNSNHPRQIPTRQNIIDAMQWLVKDAHPNDSLWFHYSGHGGQTKDLDGEEADGYDEVIYPADHEYAGHLEDDAMWEIMVRPLPPGCRLTAIFDSCHSGSVLDLPYIYSTEGKIKEPNQAAEIGKQALTAVKAYASKDMGSLFKAGMGAFKAATGSQQKAQKKSEAMRASHADVISWSGCKDSQTSADAFEAGAATGAMSFAFITSMNANPNQTYQQLLVSIREILKGKYQQKPQLSASHPMDTNILFIA